MEWKKLLLVLVLMGLIMVTIHLRSAGAETTDCTAITSLPYTITTQGIYCLTSDLSTSMTGGYAIEINTNNVVIDLNGHKLGGLAAGTGTMAYGIHAYQRQNITIKNGMVRGFYVGIYLDGASPYTTSQGHLVEDIQADNNRYQGIWVVGTGNIIRRNRVLKTGGATIFPNATGIHVVGPGARVLDNDVLETVEQIGGASSAIMLSPANWAVVSGNRLGNAGPGPGNATGVIIYWSTNVVVKDNTIANMTYGIDFNISTGSTGKYRDNLTSGVTYPFSGGTDAGGNN